MLGAQAHRVFIVGQKRNAAIEAVVGQCALLPTTAAPCKWVPLNHLTKRPILGGCRLVSDHNNLISIGGNYYSVRTRRLVEVDLAPQPDQHSEPGRLVAVRPVLECRRHPAQSGA